MVPSIVPKSSSDMLYERDSLAELTARENEVYQELDKIRWYQFEGQGRIFGAEKQQQQVQAEAGNASQSSDSRLDGPDEGIEMETDETPSTSEEDDLFDDINDDMYYEAQQPLEFFDPDDEQSDEFW